MSSSQQANTFSSSNTTTSLGREDKMFVPSSEGIGRSLEMIMQSKKSLEEILDANHLITDLEVLKWLKTLPKIFDTSYKSIISLCSNMQLFSKDIIAECDSRINLITSRINLIITTGGNIQNKRCAITVLQAIADGYVTLRENLKPKSSIQPQPLIANENDHLRFEQRSFNMQDVKSVFEITLENVTSYLESNCSYPSKCYICYAATNKQEAWVEGFLTSLREELIAVGIPAILKCKDYANGSIYTYIAGLSDASHVIVVGTPSLFSAHQGGTGITCSELILINEKRKNSKNTNDSIIPILLSGDADTSFPPYYREYSNIRDWRQKSYFANLKELIQQLCQVGTDDKKYQELWRPIERQYDYLTRSFSSDVTEQLLAKEAKEQQSQQKADVKNVFQLHNISPQNPSYTYNSPRTQAIVQQSTSSVFSPSSSTGHVPVTPSNISQKAFNLSPKNMKDLDAETKNHRDSLKKSAISSISLLKELQKLHPSVAGKDTQATAPATGNYQSAASSITN